MYKKWHILVYIEIYLHLFPFESIEPNSLVVSNQMKILQNWILNLFISSNFAFENKQDVTLHYFFDEA